MRKIAFGIKRELKVQTNRHNCKKNETKKKQLNKPTSRKDTIKDNQANRLKNQTYKENQRNKLKKTQIKQANKENRSNK